MTFQTSKVQDLNPSSRNFSKCKTGLKNDKVGSFGKT